MSLSQALNQFAQNLGRYRRFTGRHVIYETGMTTSPLSDAIAVDLKTYGMRFIGTTIVYAYLQSIGVINAHEPGCFLHRER
ncbi:DNA-3-methyladenine glycosylase I [Bifidobacterium longum]